MPITTNKTPAAPAIDQNIRSTAPWLAKSGLYEIEITNAFADHLLKKDGTTWNFIRIDGLTFESEPHRLSFKLSLPETDEYGRALKSAPNLDGLLYFLDLRNADGNLELPDPVHKEGRSKAGRDYSFDKYEILDRKRIHVLIEFRGWYVNQRTNEQIGQYDLKGICDARGFSAHDVLNGSNAPCPKHAEFLAALEALSDSNSTGSAEPAPAPAAEIRTPSLGQFYRNPVPKPNGPAPADLGASPYGDHATLKPNGPEPAQLNTAPPKDASSSRRRRSASGMAAAALSRNNRNGGDGGSMGGGDDIPF